MKRHSGHFASLALTLTSAALLNGCCCTVHVDSKGPSSDWGGDRKFTNGVTPDDSVEVIQVGDNKPVFTSTITANGPVRLMVKGHDLSDPQPKRDQVHPSFRVHFHPDHPPQDLTVYFRSPPVVGFAPVTPSSGWLYFIGKAPIGKTRRVRAVGSGTEFMIEVTDDADYVYCIGGTDDWVDVYSLLGPAPDAVCATLTYGQYTRVGEDGVCSAPAGFIGDPAREIFFKEATTEIAEEPWDH